MKTTASSQAIDKMRKINKEHKELQNAKNKKPIPKTKTRSKR